MNVIKARILTFCVCGFGGYNSEQRYQIYSGFRRYNLTKSQVKVYAKKDISCSRMRLCKHALAAKISPEEIAEWLSLTLNGYIFRYALEGRQKGIPKDKVQEYARNNISVEKSFNKYLELMAEYQCY